jgi:hypothetical protein
MIKCYNFCDHQRDGTVVFELNCSRASFLANVNFICETVPEDAELRHFYCPDCDHGHLRVILPDRCTEVADLTATYLAGALHDPTLPRTWIN